MKKLILILLSLFLLVSLSACQKPESDAARFKKEYEALNNTKDEKGKSYADIQININNTIRYCELDEIIEAFSNGTHVIYLGWESCGWCRRALPELIEAVNSYSGIYIYYYNMKDIRDGFEKDPASFKGQSYLQLVNEIKRDDFDLTPYLNFYEDGTYKLPSSLIYFIKEGEIIGVHARTVESHLDAYEPLNETQKQELQDIYTWYLEEIIRKVNPGCEACD